MRKKPLALLTKKTKTDAYWAGFLYADGCLSKYRGRWALGLALSVKDKSHVVAFSKTYGGNSVQIGSVTVKGKTHGVARVRFTSRVEPVHLYEWGIVKRKTWDWRKPTIDKQLIPSFLRGWFDGDGGYCGSVVRITNAQKEPLRWYEGQIKKLGFKGKSRMGTKNGGRHHFLSLSAYEFYNLLRGSPRLPRKWARAPKKSFGPNKEKTHCLRGHKFTDRNTYRQRGRNSRSCLTCRRSRR